MVEPHRHPARGDENRNSITDNQCARVIDLVPSLRCPLLAVFGAEDTNPSPADAAELERRLQQAGKTATVKSFPNAGHAFLADYRPSYDPAAAKDAWARMLAFLKKNGVG